MDSQQRPHGLFLILKVAAIALGLAGGAQSADSATPAGARPPNVIVFLVDDMGWRDSGAYGSTYYETPNIDALAAHGVLFTDAYSASPLCSPTRASILTGKYPARHGITTAAGHLAPRVAAFPESAPANKQTIQPESGTFLDPAEYTLAEALHDAGYVTGHFGKWHLGLTEPHWPDQQGYDIAWHGKPDPGPPGPNGYFAPYSFKAGTIQPAADGTYIVDQLTDEACKFIEQHREQPFLLSVWQFGVHGPWGHKEEYTREFANKTDPQGLQGNPVMASMLRSIDESLGKIIAKLQELELSEETIVLFTSDNGGNVHSNTEEDARAKNRTGGPQQKSLDSYHQYAGFQPPTNNAPLRAGKGTLYEGGVRVPLIVAWPGHFPEGARSAEVASAMDFYPTLLELTGVQAKEDQKFDGVSLAGVLRELSASTGREALFNYFPHGGAGKPPGVTVRKGNLKLIRWFETSRQFPAQFELYDLGADIGEQHNLAGEQPQVVGELNFAIDAFLQDTGALVPRPNPQFDPDAKDEQPVTRRAARARQTGAE